MMTFPFSEAPVVKLDGDREDGSVLLICHSKDTEITWYKDGKQENSSNGAKLNLGSSIKDPQGIYQCKGSNGTSKPLQIYYRSM